MDCNSGRVPVHVPRKMPSHKIHALPKGLAPQSARLPEKIPKGLPDSITMHLAICLPKVFHVDLPSDLVHELIKCKDDSMVKAVGVEWCTSQVKELISHGVPSIHFYSLNATQSVKQVASNVY